jgi:hypothetical protein
MERKGLMLAMVLGLFLLLSVSAGAADWVHYGGNDNCSCYYDTQSITHPSLNILRVWTRSDWTAKYVTFIVGKHGKEYENMSHSTIFYEINCAEKKMHSLSIIVYDKDGKELRRESKEWESIIPGTIGDSLYRKVCR